MNKIPALETDQNELAANEAESKIIASRCNFADELLNIFHHEPLNVEIAKQLYSFGYALYQQSRFSEAAEVFLYLLMYSKSDTKIQLALAACYQVQSDFRIAAKLYQAAIDLGHKDPSAYFHLGECLLRLNQKSEAIEQFRRAAHHANGAENLDAISMKALGILELVQKFDNA